MRKRVAAAVLFMSVSSPLLAFAKHYNSIFCTDANGARIVDATALPPDPRSLATHENGYTSGWQDCHPAGYAQPDGTVVKRPTTCAEWWSYVAEGESILESQSLLGSTVSYDTQTYSDLWKAWGLDAAPDRENFERVALERYGFQPAPFANLYPYAYDTPATCDPAANPKGCGHLPLGFVLVEGTHDVGVTCLLCHATRIGDGESKIGLGNGTGDAQLLTQDLVTAGGTPLPLPYPHNTTRGTINAVSDFEFLSVIRDLDTLDISPFFKTLPNHAYPGDQDPPNWWNTGMRPRLYMDGGVPADDTRALMMFLAAAVNESGEWIRNQQQQFEKIETFVQAVEPPPFPTSAPAPLVAVDVAAQGKMLFHTRDLFMGQSPPIAGTNGSCAGCHGVYDAAYAKPYDPSLASTDPANGALPSAASHVPSDRWPLLVGIAGQIVPRDVVGTDPGRVDALSPDLRYGWSTSWWALPDVQPDYTPPSQKNFLTEGLDEFMSTASSNEAGSAAGLPPRVQGACSWEQERIGYAAPPLHGIWASAPYFHNGSVPTVWAVLNPSARPRFWRRKLAAGVTLATGEVERGYSTSLADYDFTNLGWRYDEIPCGIVDGVDCRDLEPANAALELALRTPGGAAWNSVQWNPPLTRADVERRKIYDTRLYGKSNAGHAYPALSADAAHGGLSDADRRAIIEYLKTL